MRIAMATDHAGLALKEALKVYLQEMGHEVVDFGAHREDPTDDYPDFGLPAARAVASGECERGILCCGSGLGMMLTANKVRGIRAVVCHEPYSARLSRTHNDANVLCLGERIIGLGLAREIVRIWLETPFEGGRHARRVSKIMEAEE